MPLYSNDDFSFISSIEDVMDWDEHITQYDIDICTPRRVIISKTCLFVHDLYNFSILKICHTFFVKPRIL